MKFLENRIPPPLVALVIGLAMWGVSRWQSALPLESRLRLALMAMAGLIAISFAAAGFVAFHRAHTTVDPIHVDKASALVTNGVYRITRNPMYVGLTLLLTTWAIWLAVPWAFAGPVALVLFTQRFQILPEERAMEAKFGAEYLAYKQRVRRWL
jgi:protein-S-isoprenylcysteine O-methyltransferase Ste14